ncbi:MAG: DinB family protein [Planctomycetota bacterium]
MTPDTFDLQDGPALLRATPATLTAWLCLLPAGWLHSDEGPDTWNPLVVLGHLIEGERHDWIPRVRHLFAFGETRAFTPFDRFAQLRQPERPLADLLAEFTSCRAQSLRDLAAFDLQPADLARRGRHPEFGAVTLGQHLATWVAHDLTHIAQIARAMAQRYRDAVGPWRAYLRILREPPAK